jgi:hypothetical protein
MAGDDDLELRELEPLTLNDGALDRNDLDDDAPRLVGSFLCAERSFSVMELLAKSSASPKLLPPPPPFDADPEPKLMLDELALISLSFSSKPIKMRDLASL